MKINCSLCPKENLEANDQVAVCCFWICRACDSKSKAYVKTDEWKAKRDSVINAGMAESATSAANCN